MNSANFQFIMLDHNTCAKSNGTPNSFFANSYDHLKLIHLLFPLLSADFQPMDRAAHP